MGAYTLKIGTFVEHGEKGVASPETSGRRLRKRFVPDGGGSSPRGQKIHAANRLFCFWPPGSEPTRAQPLRELKSVYSLIALRFQDLRRRRSAQQFRYQQRYVGRRS